MAPNGALAGKLTYIPSSGQGLAGAFPALVNQDANGVATTPNELYILNNGLYVPISATNPLPTSLTGSKMTQSRQTYVLNIGAGIQQQFSFYADAGTVAEASFVGVYAPGITAATTGEQSIYITDSTNTGTPADWIQSGNSASATSALTVTTTNPIVFSDTVPLVVSIYNNTNAAQTGTGVINVIYRRRLT